MENDGDIPEAVRRSLFEPEGIGVMQPSPGQGGPSAVGSVVVAPGFGKVFDAFDLSCHGATYNARLRDAPLASRRPLHGRVHAA